MTELTGLPLEIAREMYRRMVLIRRFEDHLYALFLQGAVPGTLHQYQGQEAVAVGVCTALRPDDVIFSTHRPVGHFLARGSSARGIAAEIMGKATGCAGGKGGQMHLTDVSVGAMPSNAIVGANIPIATGAALGFQLRGQDRVAVSFFGDGASNTGAFHEGHQPRRGERRTCNLRMREQPVRRFDRHLFDDADYRYRRPRRCVWHSGPRGGWDGCSCRLSSRTGGSGKSTAGQWPDSAGVQDIPLCRSLAR